MVKIKIFAKRLTYPVHQNGPVPGAAVPRLRAGPAPSPDCPGNGCGAKMLLNPEANPASVPHSLRCGVPQISKAQSRNMVTARSWLTATAGRGCCHEWAQTPVRRWRAGPSPQPPAALLWGYMHHCPLLLLTGPPAIHGSVVGRAVGGSTFCARETIHLLRGLSGCSRSLRSTT